MQGLGLDVEIVHGQSDGVAAGTEVYSFLHLNALGQCSPFLPRSSLRLSDTLACLSWSFPELSAFCELGALAMTLSISCHTTKALWLESCNYFVHLLKRTWRSTSGHPWALQDFCGKGRLR